MISPGSLTIKSLRIAMLGAGRMGHQILREIGAQSDLALGGLWVKAASDLHGQDLAAVAGEAGRGIRADSDLAAVLAGSDVAIDFSLPQAHAEIVTAIGAARIPLVSGVSGLDDAAMQSLRSMARSIPVFYDRNMSIGVAVMRQLVQRAAGVLNAGFATAIHDTHHAAKRDAPSGTALALGEAIAGQREQSLADVMYYRPDADDNGLPARAGDIVFHVTRAGECPGRHEVHFKSDAESLSLCHEVTNRAVFALGALRAARWLAGRSPGYYDMQDLLADADAHR